MPLLARGYLNPQCMLGKHDIRKDKELVYGLKRVIKKLALDVEEEIKARQQVSFQVLKVFVNFKYLL